MSLRQADSHLGKYACLLLDRQLQAGTRLQHAVPFASNGDSAIRREHSDNFYGTSIEHYANLPPRMISLLDVRSVPLSVLFFVALAFHRISHTPAVRLQMLLQGLHYYAQPNLEESVLKSANAARQEVCPVPETIACR